MEQQPQVGDYIRIDWNIPDGRIDDPLSWWNLKAVWVEGEVMRVHRPGLDLVADVRVDRSNWMQVGSVQGIGIASGVRRIPRPGAVACVYCGASADRTRVGEVMPGRCVYRQSMRYEDGALSLVTEWLDKELADLAKAVRP